jgi:hypothetical protein
MLKMTISSHGRCVSVSLLLRCVYVVKGFSDVYKLRWTKFSIWLRGRKQALRTHNSLSVFLIRGCCMVTFFRAQYCALPLLWRKQPIFTQRASPATILHKSPPHGCTNLWSMSSAHSKLPDRLTFLYLTQKILILLPEPEP